MKEKVGNNEGKGRVSQPVRTECAKPGNEREGGLLSDLKEV